MSLGLLGPEAVRILVIVVLLVGVPLFFIGVVALITGYIQHDADRFLEELEPEGDPIADPPNDADEELWANNDE